MKIVTLIENTTDNPNLMCENGLSLFIEFNDLKIIFDTGTSKNFISNAKVLGINVEDIDYVIISHAHSGHTGGLAELLAVNTKAKVFMKPEVLDDYYISYGPMNKYIGINKKVFEKNKQRFYLVKDDVKIFNDGYLISNIISEDKYRAQYNSFMELKDNNLINDSFQHELFFVIVQNHKLIIFTGCSHNGIVNIVETAMRKFKNTPIHSLVGGFHLVEMPPLNEFNYTPNYIDRIMLKLYKYNIEKFYTCHCTGIEAFNNFKMFFKDNVQYIRTGKIINIE